MHLVDVYFHNIECHIIGPFGNPIPTSPGLKIPYPIHPPSNYIISGVRFPFRQISGLKIPIPTNSWVGDPHSDESDLRFIRMDSSQWLMQEALNSSQWDVS